MGKTPASTTIAEVRRLRDSEAFEDAIQLSNQVIADDPRNYLILSERSECLFSTGRYEDAFRDLELMTQLRPESASAYYVRAKWHLQLGNYESAIADASMALELQDEYFADTVRFFRAVALYSEGDLERALVDCNSLPADFESAVETPSLGWRVLSRAELRGLLGQ